MSGTKQPLHDNDCMWGTPILHNDAQNIKGVLVFADQFFRCKVVDIRLNQVFLFGHVKFDNWHCHLYY